jgi:hypothetical protein
LQQVPDKPNHLTRVVPLFHSPPPEKAYSEAVIEPVLVENERVKELKNLVQKQGSSAYILSQ